MRPGRRDLFYQMNTTSVTLLEKLCRRDDEAAWAEAWARFVRLYAPLLLAWARAHRLQDADAADFVQDVLMRLTVALPRYRRTEGHTFRGWLFTIVANLYRDFCRKCRGGSPGAGADALAGVEGPVSSHVVAEMDEREYRLRLARQGMEVIRADFSETSWKAFQMLAVQGRPVAEVAEELGISADAAHAARRRVIDRLRELLADFLE
jgi:RNA polymerase sigma factor (sigma-70 family)